MIEASLRAPAVVHFNQTDATAVGASLTIAQRFNAGCDNEMKIESGSCRTKETLCRPDGTQQRGMRNAQR